VAKPVILLTNVGNQDLTAPQDCEALAPGGVPVPSRKLVTPFRAHTERLWQRIQEGTVQASAFGSAITERAVDRILEDEHRIDRIILFATDQPRPQGLEGTDHWNRDTVHAASVLAWWLPKTHSRIRDAVVHSFTGTNADDPGAWRDFFAKHLSEAVGEQYVGTCYVALSSGIPGANYTLLLQALELWRGSCRTIIVPQSGEVALSTIGQKVLRQFQRAPASKLLREGQFTAAASVLEGWGVPNAPVLALMCRAIQHRLDFDASGMLDALSKARRMIVGSEADCDDRLLGMLTDVENECRQFAPTVSPLDRIRAQLVDLYWGTDLARRQHRLVDFVARATSVVENALRFEVHRTVGVSAHFIERDHRARTAFFNAVSRYPTVAAVKACRRAHTLQVNFTETSRINIPVLMVILDAVAENPLGGVSPESVRAAVMLGETLAHVRDLRNQSAIAHGMDGISRRVIGDCFREGIVRATGATPSGEDDFLYKLSDRLDDRNGCEKIMEMLKRMLEHLHVPIGSDPFRSWGSRFAVCSDRLE